MLLLLSLPILVNTHYILVIWLKLIPAHTVSFVQLTLIFAMCESVSYPLITAMLATGNIRNYQLVVGGLQLFNLPVSYILLRLGFVPETVLVVAIIISQLCLLARLIMLRGMINLSFWQFTKKVYLNVIFVAVFASIVPVSLTFYINETFVNFLLTSMVAIICSSFTIYFVGCTKIERHKIKLQVIKICNKIKQ